MSREVPHSADQQMPGSTHMVTAKAGRDVDHPEIGGFFSRQVVCLVLPDFRRRLRGFGPKGLPSRSSAPPRRSTALLGCVKYTTDTRE